jgi:predicted aspartyl protease
MKRHSAWIGAAFLMIASNRFVRAEVALTPAGDGHDTVPVFVNGRGPYPFILDTGAEAS